MAARRPGRRRSLAGAGIFGFGLGGLVDGIVLHLVLGWHSIASQQVAATGVEGMRRNLLWDGVFHVVDHLVFHELLSLHDIRDDVADPLLYNVGFVAMGLLLIALGSWLLRARQRPRGAAPALPTRD